MVDPPQPFSLISFWILIPYFLLFSVFPLGAFFPQLHSIIGFPDFVFEVFLLPPIFPMLCTFTVCPLLLVIPAPERSAGILLSKLHHLFSSPSPPPLWFFAPTRSLVFFVPFSPLPPFSCLGRQACPHIFFLPSSSLIGPTPFSFSFPPPPLLPHEYLRLIFLVFLAPHNSLFPCHSSRTILSYPATLFHALSRIAP